MSKAHSLSDERLSGFKVAIIICYFGELPDYFLPFLITCSNNPDYNWIIITDDKRSFPFPDNVSIVQLTIHDIELRIKNQIGDWAILNNPYKLCDYKPAFGLLFQDLLEGYSHWGYGDIDVVYGQLNHFITAEMLEQYDKIYPLGHFSIVKNNDICKKAFMIAEEETNDFREVYSSTSSFYFDEYKGINEKMMAHGLKVYCNIDFLDASAGGYSRIHLIDRRIFKLVFKDSDYVQYNYPPNYKRQSFIIKNKRLFHVYYKNKRIVQTEYSYLHYRKKLMVKLNNLECDMIIGNEKITELNEDITEDLIDTSNKMKTSDNLTFLRFAKKRRIKSIKNSTKRRIVKMSSSIYPVRKAIDLIKNRSK